MKKCPTQIEWMLYILLDATYVSVWLMLACDTNKIFIKKFGLSFLVTLLLKNKSFKSAARQILETIYELVRVL